jgi:hypothetical protein
MSSSSGESFRIGRRGASRRGASSYRESCLAVAARRTAPAARKARCRNRTPAWACPRQLRNRSCGTCAATREPRSPKLADPFDRRTARDHSVRAREGCVTSLLSAAGRLSPSGGLPQMHRQRSGSLRRIGYPGHECPKSPRRGRRHHVDGRPAGLRIPRKSSRIVGKSSTCSSTFDERITSTDASSSGIWRPS